MAKPLEWERQDTASYVWPLGLHYYTERDEDKRWPVSCMVGDSDIWNGGRYITRQRAEDAMQKHFDEQIAQFTDWERDRDVKMDQNLHNQRPSV